MKEVIFNGILCLHDIRTNICDNEVNPEILFLHNEQTCLAELVGAASQNIDRSAYRFFFDPDERKKIGFSYYVSENQQTLEQAVENTVREQMGDLRASVETSGQPYSEVTPDICYDHDNEFKIGGHDLNRELRSHIGKWLLIRVQYDLEEMN